MAKKKSITRISDKKRGRPKVRFSIWGLILIFALSFTGWFVVYMVAANFNEDFFSEEMEKGSAADKSSDKASSDNTETNEADTSDESKKGSTNPIARSAAKGEEYLSTCCLVTDQTLIDMGKYTELKDVIGSSELTAAGCNSVNIESAYGNNNVYELLKVKKPSTIYIMLGCDIGTSSIDDMIASYTDLVKNLRGALKEADIYIMQLPPVHDDPNAPVNNGMINEFNTKLLTIANTNNVYCIDTNTALKGVDGTISEGCRDSATGALTGSAYETIAEYILCHTV